MGLVFDANSNSNKTRVRTTKPIIRHLVVKELTSVNQGFLESLGINVIKSKNVGRGD